MICQLHKIHLPNPTYLESHHVIPQAWQRAWRPSGASRVIWAPDTVELCATGHRNVHFYLVKLMKGQNIGRRNKKEVLMAQSALDLFTKAGGDLSFLREKGLWGEA